MTSILPHFITAVSTITLLAAAYAQPLPPEAEVRNLSGRAVLLVGIDGLRSDALQLALSEGKAEHLKGLVESGTVTWSAYAGGSLDTATQQPTLSGPGWTSILTGVWTDRHQVVGNDTPPVDQPGVRGSYMASQAPHFATRLKAAVPTVKVASFVSWGWIEDYLVAAQPAAFDIHAKGSGLKYEERDANVTRKALDYLQSNDPDVLILHYDQVDHAGHTTGFSADNPIYLDAIQRVDAELGKVLQALRQKPSASMKKRLILITTDHGGRGKSHGGQSPEERTIPFIVNGPDIPAG